jgi:hypothetical protein
VTSPSHTRLQIKVSESLEDCSQSALLGAPDGRGLVLKRAIPERYRKISQRSVRWKRPRRSPKITSHLRTSSEHSSSSAKRCGVVAIGIRFALRRHPCPCRPRPEPYGYRRNARAQDSGSCRPCRSRHSTQCNLELRRSSRHKGGGGCAHSYHRR